jgi:hypothetical protein
MGSSPTTVVAAELAAAVVAPAEAEETPEPATAVVAAPEPATAVVAATGVEVVRMVPAVQLVFK